MPNDDWKSFISSTKHGLEATPDALSVFCRTL
jgi:hypothetical protein